MDGLHTLQLSRMRRRWRPAPYWLHVLLALALWGLFIWAWLTWL